MRTFKRILSYVLLLALCLSPIGPQAVAEEAKELNLLTWEGYIDAEIIAAFTAETGIKVNFLPMASNEEMLLKLDQSSGGEYDLVIASDYALSILRKAELLQPLDRTKLSNYGNLDPAYLSHFYDPDNEYVIPYTAGTPLIVYDPALVDIDITGYADLWNPALADSIAIMDDARNVVGITLKVLGYSFNETDPAILELAKEKLMELYPNIRVFDYDNAYAAVVSGEASVGYMFSSQVCWALAERPDLKVVYPKEGMGFGIDGAVIPAGAPHPDNAHIFLDYLLRADVAAHNAEAQQFMNPNMAANALLSPEYLNNPALYIPSEILGKTEFIQDVGDTETLFQEIYNDFKLQ